MARPSKYNWIDAEKDYRAGMSRQEVKFKYKLPDSGLSERIKHWEVSETSIAVQRGFDSVSEKIKELSETQPELIETTMEIVKRSHPEYREIIDRITIKNLIGLESSIDNLHEVSDRKLAQDTIHKAGQTLGVVDQFAQKGDVNVQTNVQQNNKEWNVKLPE